MPLPIGEWAAAQPEGCVAAEVNVLRTWLSDECNLLQVRQLQKGAFAAGVFLGHDEQLGTPVALKFIPRSQASKVCVWIHLLELPACCGSVPTTGSSTAGSHDMCLLPPLQPAMYRAKGLWRRRFSTRCTFTILTSWPCAR